MGKHFLGYAMSEGGSTTPAHLGAREGARGVREPPAATSKRHCDRDEFHARGRLRRRVEAILDDLLPRRARIGGAVVADY